jgi:Phosphotransferase enzyme family
VTVAHAVSDRELLEALCGHLDGRKITAVRRRPYRYATSASLEEVIVVTEGGGEVGLLLKDLSRQRLLDEARATKPDFLYEPGRELETYRRILAPAGIGPRCVAAVHDAARSRHWLLIEKVAGVELWQVGELSVWEKVAAWLGRFHAAFAARVDELRLANPHLLEHSDAWFRAWWDRARTTLGDSEDPRAPELVRVLARYHVVAKRLAALPHTLVHGELYPSNVVVVQSDSALRVYPVDWEMAAIGTGLMDLAALVGGWDVAQRQRLVAAYCTGAGSAAPAGLGADLDRCRLHLALQWLGWSADWRPPPEHAHDWLGEAMTLARELGLE